MITKVLDPNLPQLCRHGMPTPGFKTQPCNCAPGTCRLGRTDGVPASSAPTVDSAGWCKVCGHGNDRRGQLHLSDCPNKPSGVAPTDGGQR